MGFSGRRSEKGMVGQRPSLLKALSAALVMALFWSVPIYLFGFRTIWESIQYGGGGFMYIPLIMMIAMMIIPPVSTFFAIMNGGEMHLGKKHEDGIHKGKRTGLTAMLQYALEKNHAHPEAEDHKHGEHVEATGSILSVEDVHHEELKLERLYNEGYLTKEQYKRKLERVRE